MTTDGWRHVLQIGRAFAFVGLVSLAGVACETTRSLDIGQLTAADRAEVRTQSDVLVASLDATTTHRIADILAAEGEGGTSLGTALQLPRCV